jgi:hypothetical protein
MRVDAHSRRKPPASGRRGRGETGVEEDPNNVGGGEEGLREDEALLGGPNEERDVRARQR